MIRPRITDERVIQINAAMEKASGNKDLAAALLNMRPSRLSTEIRQSKELRARWADQRTGLKQQAEPAEAATLARPNVTLEPNGQQPTETEMQLLEQITQEDALLSRGIQGLGLTGEELALANELAQYGHGHTVDTIHIITGSVTRMCMKLQTQAAEVEKRLAAVREKLRSPWLEPIVVEGYKGSTTVLNPRKDLVREEQALSASYVSMGSLIARMFDCSQRAVLLQAMMRYRGKQGTLPKPGYQQFDHQNATGTLTKLGNGNGED